jgi:predicted nucleotide-binding protein
MQTYEELFALAKRLNEAADAKQSGEISEPLQALEKAANEVKRSFSGSWLGYHSCVYYQGLVPAPPGANFSPMRGLKDRSYTGRGSLGDWCQFDPEEVKAHIRLRAGKPNQKPAEDAAEKAVSIFGEAKSEILSILEGELEDRPDGFLGTLKAELDSLEPMSVSEIVQRWAPKRHISSDMLAMGQGTSLPPHISILAEVTAIQLSFDICKRAADIAAKAASHLERKSRKKLAADRIGTNVFIGHGRSQAWRELKDFVQDRLTLPWDEFNRIPVAGVTNIARLSEMLDAAAIALLVMTAEDEMADGDLQARMNVVHEAGLFQGRLGFTRAIVLLEEGCSELSNIQGLGQIRFPKGNIAASFEEVRRVMEREGLIGGNDTAREVEPRERAATKERQREQGKTAPKNQRRTVGSPRPHRSK